MHSTGVYTEELNFSVYIYMAMQSPNLRYCNQSTTANTEEQHMHRRQSVSSPYSQSCTQIDDDVSCVFAAKWWSKLQP